MTLNNATSIIKLHLQKLRIQGDVTKRKLKKQEVGKRMFQISHLQSDTWNNNQAFYCAKH